MFCSDTSLVLTFPCIAKIDTLYRLVTIWSSPIALFSLKLLLLSRDYIPLTRFLGPFVFLLILASIIQRGLTTVMLRNTIWKKLV